jgi:putative PIG3 family NAD(P)H quinone oxidoreductase
MRAITISEPGDADVLTVTEVEAPSPGQGEVLIDVVAAGVNRADVQQRKGYYPPPKGASELPGLEVSGRVSALGPGTVEAGWAVGDEVCALLAGGGYAQTVAVPVGQLLPVPSGVGLADAAALPEVACTVWSNLAVEAGLRAGETVLIHGGSSGIGTMAIQVAKQLGARVAVTAGSPGKLDACRDLGADVLVNYKEQDFVEEIRSVTDGRGADVILDVVGAKYLSRNVDALAPDGRLVVIGLLGGTKGELNLGQLLGKRGRVIATSLRSRPLEGKAQIVASVREHVWPWIEEGTVRTVIQSRYPLAQAAQAHREMEASGHVGKILLDVADV